MSLLGFVNYLAVLLATLAVVVGIFAYEGSRWETTRRKPLVTPPESAAWENLWPRLTDGKLPAVDLSVWLRPTQGCASWFGESLRGSPMANGRPCDPSAMTCAMRLGSEHRGSKYLVRSVQTGDSVVVELTDWGPAERTGCLIDLSRAAYEAICPPGGLDAGHIEVEIFLIREMAKR